MATDLLSHISYYLVPIKVIRQLIPQPLTYPTHLNILISPVFALLELRAFVNHSLRVPFPDDQRFANPP